MSSFKTRDESGLWMDVVVALCKSKPETTDEYKMRKADELVKGFQERNAAFITRAEELLKALADGRGSSFADEFDLPKIKDPGNN
jgi:lipopolysaccharide biosynthesis regulator YciM